jgi:outer membrane protein TolC
VKSLIGFARLLLSVLIGIGLLSGHAIRCQAQTEELASHQALSLKDCLRIAMEKNHSRPASRFAVAMAEAQHRQALSSYWPQVNAKGGITRLDEAPNFIFPASNMYIPSQSISVPGGTATVTIPANAFGPGFPPAPIQMPVSFPGQTVSTSVQIFPIPAQNVRLINPTTESVEGSFTWLLLDGGTRRGYREQALGAVDAAKAESHRTDLELSDSVVRLYYGAVLARQLRKLGDDTLARMEATLSVTEALYKEGSGTVTKADYLDNKVMADTVRSIVAPLEKNEASAEAALAYTLGLSWKASIEPQEEEVPFQPYNGNLDALVSAAYESNPDWNKIDAGLRAFEGQRRIAVSDHYPKLAITGNLHRWWNDYDGGLSTTNNRAGWTVGAGVQIPLFDGFLASAKVAEARAKINMLKEQKLLLREGIGLQIRDLFLSLAASEKTYQASLDAMKTATDDRDLTTRAYESGLVATERVIRVQLQEALVSAGYYKAAYDHRALQSSIELIVGTEIQNESNSAH